MKKPILTLIFLVTLATTGFSEKVSGQFKTTKNVIKPVTVAAFPSHSHDDRSKMATTVVLAEGTMNINEAVQALDPHTHLVNQKGMRGKNYITFVINSNGSVAMNATVSEGMVQYGDFTKDMLVGGKIPGSLEATFTENSSARVAGRIHTIKPVKLASEIYELDVEFDTPITPLPAGIKLSEGGSDPGKAFLAFIAAINAKNWKGLQAGASAKILADLDPEASDSEKTNSLIDSVNFLLPQGKKIKILRGEQFQDSAKLEVQGQMSEEGGPIFLYLVRMLKEQGSWHFDSSTIAGPM